MSKEQFIPYVENVHSFLLRFQDSDLIDGTLLVQHNLRAQYPVVVVYNNANQVVTDDVDSITYLDEDRILLDVNDFTPLPGAWHVRVVRD